MKTWVVVTALTVFCSVAWCGDEPSVGDSVERVHELMGPPKGHLKSGGMQLLIYDRGRVEIRAGLVTAVNLVSAAHAERLQRERERQWAARQELIRQQRQERLEQAERIRLSMLVDEELNSKSADEQLKAWQEFQMRHPEVDVSDKIAALLDAYESQQKEREVVQRLAELERRLQQAERRARLAEQQVIQSGREFYYEQPLRYYYYPVPRVHAHPRPDHEPQKPPRFEHPSVPTALPYPLRTPSSTLSPARQRLYRGYGGGQNEECVRNVPESIRTRIRY